MVYGFQKVEKPPRKYLVKRINDYDSEIDEATKGRAKWFLLLDKYYPSVNLKNSGSDHPYIFIYNDNCDLKMDFQSEVRGS